MSKFKVNIINNNIYHLVFGTQKDLCDHMVRIEEFYESPVFKERHFELEEYRLWYSEKYGQWSYYSDWDGFNIPDYSINNFKELFKDLRPQEKAVLSQLPIDQKYYVIATHGVCENNDVLAHEIAHAMFYLNLEYKEEMLNLIEKNRESFSSLASWILISYDHGVLDDEIQAYMATSDHKFFKEKKISVDKKLVKEFKKIFKKYNNYL